MSIYERVMENTKNKIGIFGAIIFFATALIDTLGGFYLGLLSFVLMALSYIMLHKYKKENITRINKVGIAFAIIGLLIFSYRFLFLH